MNHRWGDEEVHILVVRFLTFRYAQHGFVCGTDFFVFGCTGFVFVGLKESWCLLAVVCDDLEFPWLPNGFPEVVPEAPSLNRTIFVLLGEFLLHSYSRFLSYHPIGHTASVRLVVCVRL